jgi:MFS family permease
LVTIEFPAKREEYMGYCESAVGIGLMIGPVLGSLIYGFVGYAPTFYIFGSVIGLGLIIVFFLLPPRLNHTAAF